MKIILAAILAAVLSCAGTIAYLKSNQATAIAEESTYDRVNRTGILRCGYGIEQPMSIIDPNTGKITGATAEIVEKVADLLGLKVEWTEQVGWSEMTAGLMAGRYDMICNGKWILSREARGGQFTAPLYYTAVYAYGRPDEMRLDDLTKLNNQDFTIVTLDGDINYYLARDKFPQARRVEMPALTDPGQLIMNVTTKKADVVFLAAFTAEAYLKEHPGALKQLKQEPITVFDTAFMFKSGDAKFAGVLDAAVREIRSNGFIDEVFNKYNVSETAALRLATPYVLPSHGDK